MPTFHTSRARRSMGAPTERTHFSLADLVTIGDRINGQEFDHPFILNPDGTVEDAPDSIYAPDAVNGPYSPDSPHDVIVESGWECAVYGMSGQDSYKGGVMHPSEYIGAGLARLLLSDEPVILAVVEVRDDDGAFPDGDPIGWTVLRKMEA